MGGKNSNLAGKRWPLFLNNFMGRSTRIK